MTAREAIAFWGGPVGFLLALLLLPGGEVHQGALAGTALWMLWWWIGGAVPLGPTSLLPLALFPPFGVMDLTATAAPFGSRFIWLFLGGFVLALALERHGLHRRFALHLLHRLGGGPRRTLLGFMLATALLSMWISNTATTLMMLPMATAVLALLEERSGPLTWGPA
ncbi:MAG: SLC13 family permease, partial [Flavobacteriales bacterium]